MRQTEPAPDLQRAGPAVFRLTKEEMHSQLQNLQQVRMIVRLGKLCQAVKGLDHGPFWKSKSHSPLLWKWSVRVKNGLWELEIDWIMQNFPALRAYCYSHNAFSSDIATYKLGDLTISLPKKSVSSQPASGQIFAWRTDFQIFQAC